MSIEAKVIADSVAPCGERLISIQATYPRIVLAEVNTHGAIAKNSASSRAIPIDKMIQRVLDNPGMPVHWGKNQKGMQAEEELDEAGCAAAEAWWLESMQLAVEQARKGQALGLHKQVVNRIIEPYQHMVTLMSATNWNNFFWLRYHKDADPTFQALAKAIYEAIQASTPQILAHGEWHLPYITFDDRVDAMKRAIQQAKDEGMHVDRFINKRAKHICEQTLLKVSTGRSARTSYLTQEGKRDLLEDIALYDRLKGAPDAGQPGHWSPFEHQGRAETVKVQSGRFTGFTQHRKLFANENMIHAFTPGGV